MTNETPMCQCGKAAIDFAHDMPSSNLFNHEVVPAEESEMTGITHTVGVNVVDGTIRVDLPDDDDTAAWDDLAEPEGGIFNGTTIEPWGVDEESMDRADAALAEFGFERVGPWSDDDERPTATIRRAR